MHDLLHVMPKDLRPTKLANYKKIPKKIPEILGSDNKYPADHPNAKF